MHSKKTKHKKNTVYAQNLLKRFEAWLGEVMKNRKLKKTIGYVLIFVVVAAGAGAYYMFHDSRKASAAWWNDSWQYRKPIAITNSSGSDLTDFQVKALSGVDLSSDVTAGKVKSDLGDLRFTDINGEVLPYWIEDSTTSSVDAWVKMPAIATSGATVYMYYGNANAISAQDGEDVFEFFDDFNNSVRTNSLWSSPWPGWAVENGEYSGGGGYYSMADYTSLNNYIVEAKVNNNAGGHAGLVARATENNRYYEGEIEMGNTTQYIFRMDDPLSYTLLGSSSGSAPSSGTWYNLKLAVNGSSISFSNLSLGNTTTVTDSTYSSGKPGVWIWSDSHVHFDDFRVRKYVATDPSAAAPSTEEKGTGPVGYWSFDEGYGTTASDSTANNNDGAISNAVWKTKEQCVSGKCLYFDGTGDNVNLGSSNIIDITGDVSYEAWIKLTPTTYPDATTNYHIFTNESYQNYGMMFRVDGTSQKLDYRTSQSGASQYSRSSQQLEKNRWYHVALVRSGADATFYVDGKATGETTNGTHTDPIDSSTNLLIGTASSQAFFGFIDEPKIYNYARTAAQIKMDYNVGLAGTGGQEGVAVSAGKRSSQWMTNGLVGHWKMDEASWNGTAGEVKDWSGNGNNGTAVGGAAVATGKFGNGGGFDGSDDYVNIGTPNSLNITGNVSVGAWVKTGISSVTYGNSALAGNYSQYFLSLGDYTASTPRVTGYVNISGVGWKYIKGNTAINDGQWHYVSMTYDGNYVRVYKDGILDANPYPASGGLASPSNFLLGAYGAGNVTNANLDDVRIYNRALSDREIRDLYNYAPGPVAYWNMEEGSGTLANDSSGNNNTGTLTNGPVWASGKYGKAVNFDGSDDFIQAGSTNFPTGSSDRTILMWIKPKSITNWGGFLGYGTEATNNAFLWGWDGTNARMRMGAYNNNADNANNTDIPLNQWSYIGVTFSGTTVNYYLNGRYDGAASVSSANTILDYLMIGKHYITAQKFDGLIDDVKVYNYVRSAKQITEDMNAGHPAGGSPVGSQVGYWKFDEGYGTTVYDSSPQKNNGTITGATWSNSGKFGKALYFDGSGDYVTVGSSPISNSVDPFTVSLWAKPELINSWQRLYNNYDHVAIQLASTGQGMDNKWRWFYYNAAYGGDGLLWDVRSDTAAVIGQWYHIVAVNDGMTARLYINGVKQAMEDAIIPYAISGNEIIGFGNGTEYFKGTIDEVKIYNYALTPDEVKVDFNKGAALKLGSVGTDASGKPSDSADRAYCPPGDTTASCAPVAEWKFEEGISTTANDSSGSGNTGTLTNGPIWTNGKIGKALKFDGSDDYVDAGNASNLTFGSGQSFTYSAWIYSETPAAGYWQGIIYHGDGAQSQGHLGINPTGYLSGGTGDGATWATSETSYAIPRNTWVYLTMVLDRNTNIMKFYANSTQVASFSHTSVPSAPSINLRIGDGNTSASEYFDGKIDEARIYNYARTPAQIAWDYNRGAPIAYWKFDEGEGLIAHDSSGNNSGTLTNMDGATDWVAGKKNTALDFDGSNDYVDVGANIIPTITEGSVSAWFKRSSTSGTYEMIFTDAGSQLELCFVNAGLYFYVDNAAILTTRASSYGTWYHVVGTFSQTGNYKKIYINGAEAVSGAYTGDATAANRYIGSRAGSYPFAGQIDDVQVFNYALTAQQVKNLYSGGGVKFGN